jgi:hypothetical protein
LNQNPATAFTSFSFYSDNALQDAPPMIKEQPDHGEQPHHRACGSSERRACCGVFKTPVHEHHRQCKPCRNPKELLNYLGYGRRIHILQTLKKSPERRHHRDKEQSRRNRHHGHLCTRIAKVRDDGFCAEKQHSRRADADGEKKCKGYAKNPVGFIIIAQCVALRHHARDSHRDTCGRKSQKQYIDRICRLIIPHSRIPDNVGQRYAKNRAHHLYDEPGDP